MAKKTPPPARSKGKPAIAFANATPAVRAAMLWADTVLAIAGQPCIHAPDELPKEVAELHVRLRADRAADLKSYPPGSGGHAQFDMFSDAQGEARDMLEDWLFDADGDPKAMAIIAERLRFCMSFDARLFEDGPPEALIAPKGLRDDEGALTIPWFGILTDPISGNFFSLDDAPEGQEPSKAMARLYVALEKAGVAFDPELQASYEKEQKAHCAPLFKSSFASREGREEAMPRLRAMREAREIASLAKQSKKSRSPSRSL